MAERLPACLTLVVSPAVAGRGPDCDEFGDQALSGVAAVRLHLQFVKQRVPVAVASPQTATQ
jgi:hypothetical protein